MKKITALLTISALFLCTACSNSSSRPSDDSVFSTLESSDIAPNEDSINDSDSLLSDNIVHVDWERNKVYQWQDYSESDEYPFEEDFVVQIELADFPDTVFIWQEYNISSYANGEKRVLASGMPLWNAFFTDLNFDGFPELCTTASFGSGICDDHIIVYDYHNEKEYELWDRMEFDYSLYLENDELYVRRLPYPRDENTEASIGKLVIENEELVMKQ